MIRSNSTAVVLDQTDINSALNEVLNIKIFKNSDVHTQVLGFSAFLADSLRQRILEYNMNPLTNLGDNWVSVLQTLEVKLVENDDSNQVNQIKTNQIFEFKQFVCVDHISNGTNVIFRSANIWCAKQ